MRTQRSLAVACAGAVICIVVIWFTVSIGGEERVYEVRPQVTVPEYRTDAGRAIDAYERLMERNMNLTEKILDRLGTDSQAVDKKLEDIEGKLTELLARTARIEKAIGIGPADANSVQGKPHKN